MRDARAFTLLEVVVASLLLVVLGFMIVRFLIPVHRASVRGASRGGLQSRALFALERMARDLELATASYVTVLNSTNPDDPVGFALIPLAEVTDAGSQLRETHAVCYYWLPAEARVYRKQCPPDPPDLGLTWDPAQPPRLTEDHLRDICLNGTGRGLASHVTAFSVSQEDGDRTFYLRIRLEEHAVAGEQVEVVELARRVSLRNH